MSHPAYKRTVTTCAMSLILGAALLALLMETREMAPLRKYVVNTQGDIVGVAKPEKKADVTDADTVKLKQQVEQRVEKAKQEEVQRKDEKEKRAQDLIVPSVPEEGSAAVSHIESPKPEMVVPKPEISVPKVEKVE